MPVGFIQDDLDLKLLVLYIMDRTAGPITFLQLFELALCDAGVDYFSLTQAVDQMVATGQLTREDDRYAITDKGRRNNHICQGGLPTSVRRHCDENLVRVNEALRRESQVRAQIIEREDGTATLCLTLEDGSSPLLHVALLSPNRERAEQWAAVFRDNPSALYLNIMKLLNQEDEHETE